MLKSVGSKEKTQYVHQVYSGSEKSKAAHILKELSLCTCNFLTRGDRGGLMNCYTLRDWLFNGFIKWSVATGHSASSKSTAKHYTDPAQYLLRERA